MINLEWQYSRNQRRHWVDDGNLYIAGEIHPSGRRLLEISTNRPLGFIRRNSDVYILHHKGIIVMTSQGSSAVKDLKLFAEKIK